MSMETVIKDKNVERLQQLADGPFKNFYLENPKEQKFLFSKVGADELVLFSESEFSLADVLKCRYIGIYLKKRNISKSLFEKNLLNYIKNAIGRLNTDREKQIKKYAVHFIEEHYSDQAIGYDADEFMCYNNFKRDEQRYLTEALIYVFKDKNILEKFKEGNYYRIKPLEAIFMLLILDDKNKEELKHIRFCEVQMIKRKFMKSLKRYAAAICKMRELSCGTNYMLDIYDKRLEALKSDLPAVRNHIVEIENELTKKDRADHEKVIKKTKKCIKKLKSFVKRYERSLQNKISEER